MCDDYLMHPLKTEWYKVSCGGEDMCPINRSANTPLGGLSGGEYPWSQNGRVGCHKDGVWVGSDSVWCDNGGGRGCITVWLGWLEMGGVRRGVRQDDGSGIGFT